MCRCDAATHARWVAALSHMPHALAFALASTAGSLVPDEGAMLAAGSFRDGTRVARSDPDAWTEILMENRENIIETMNAMMSELNAMKRALEEGDEMGLAELLRSARDSRLRFPQ